MLLPLHQSLGVGGFPDDLPELIFDPSQVTSATLACWLRADVGLYQDTARTTPAVANNDPVRGWADQSGGGHHGVIANTADPAALKTASINGINAVYFDTTNPRLTTGLTLTVPYTLLVVAQQTAKSPGRVLDTSDNSAYVTIDANDNKGAFLGSQYVSSGKVGTLNVAHFLQLSVPASGASYLIDQIDFTTTSGIAASWPGLAVGNGSQAMNGYVCEVLAFEGSLSAYDLARLYFWLNRWGVYTYLTGDQMTGYIDATQLPYSGNLQAAVNAAAQGQSVWLGSNTFTLSQPLLRQTPQVRIQGASKFGATIQGGGFYGPLMVIQPANRNPTMTTALLTGTGNALQFAGTSSDGWYQLRDINTVNLDGAAAMCLEFCFKPSNTGAGTAGGVTSQGRRSASDTRTFAFGIQQGNSGSVTAYMTVGGVKYTLNSAGATLVNGTAIYLALTYDGSTIRLFGGPPGGSCTVLASQAATGTVAHPVTEDVLIGGILSVWPECNGFSNFAAAGVYDGIRISNTARYTSSFTAPSAKITTTDSNTLGLLNFDSFIADGGTISASNGPLAKCYVGASGVGWLPYRVQNVAVTAGQHVTENVALVGSSSSYAVWQQFCYQNEYRHLVISGCAAGLFFGQDTYDSQIDDVTISAPSIQAPSGLYSTRFAVNFDGAAGSRHVHYLFVTGFTYGVVTIGGDTEFSSLTFNAAPDVVAYLLLRSDGSQANSVVLMNFGNDDEGVSNTPLQAAMILVGLNAFKMTGGEVEMVNNASAGYAAVIDGGGNYVFDTVMLNAGAGKVTAFAHPATAPAALVNSNCNLGSVPFSA